MKNTENKKSMLDFIKSCPRVMHKNLSESKALTSSLVKAYLDGNYQQVVIVASGSSSNASHCARLFMKKYLQCEVKIINPFSFIHSENYLHANDFLIFISQSGYSSNILQAIELAKKSNKKVIALTGDVNSDIAKVSDLVIDYGSSNETVSFVTQGVSTLCLYLMLFALETAKSQETIKQSEYEDCLTRLSTCIDCSEDSLRNFKVFFEEHYKQLTGMKTTFICSIGSGMGTAYEAALKFSETISIPAFAYECEEFIHGPNIQLTPNYTVFFIDAGLASQRIKQIYEGTKIITDNCFLISNSNSNDNDKNIFSIKLDSSNELISPIAYLPIFQWTACTVTDLLSNWHKHPLEQLMEKVVAAKSENYINSPFKQ